MWPFNSEYLSAREKLRRQIAKKHAQLMCDFERQVWLAEEKPMSREKEAVELLREWSYIWVGEIHADEGPLLSRTKAFLAKHDIVKCHCGGEVEMKSLDHTYWGEHRVVCRRCGHAGKSSKDENGAKRNWQFAQEAIREKRRKLDDGIPACPYCHQQPEDLISAVAYHGTIYRCTNCGLAANAHGQEKGALENWRFLVAAIQGYK